MSNGTFVVTGASGALGARVAIDLCVDGFTVYGVARDEQHLAAAMAREGGAPRGLQSLAFDPASPEGWAAHKAWDGRELLGAVLTAGAWAGGAPLAETSDETFEGLWRANFETARVSLAALLPQLTARGGGSVVLVGSRAAVRPWESAGASAYAATKGALSALALAAAEEVREQGVRVNVVLPSVIDTPANRAMPHAAPERWVTPASLSAVIRFLLSPAARDVSGALLPVYGRV